MTIKELFIETINQGLAAAKLVQDPALKANAYAAIAQSLALSGQIKSESCVSIDSVKEDLKVETTKGKGKNSKKKSEPVVEVTEEPVVEAEVTEEAVEDVEVVEEVTEEAVEDITEEGWSVYKTWSEEEQTELAEEIEFLVAISEAYASEAIDEQVETYSEGVYKSANDINPSNIRGFVAFLSELLSE